MLSSRLIPFRSFVAALALFGATGAHAEIRELARMSDIRSSVDRSTWVVFDLDNTILAPVQSLGSDQWYDTLVKDLGSVDRAVKLWSTVQKKTAVRAVEPTTPRLVRDLQHSAARVFALTARPADLAATTRKQLASIGVEFSRIIYVGPESSKGDAMLREIARSGTPRNIVFVDDKRKHVESVEKALNGRGIAHVEFRYGAADAAVRGLDLALTDLELAEFRGLGTLMSDAEAKRFLAEGARKGVRDPQTAAYDQAALDVNDGNFPGRVDDCGVRKGGEPGLLVVCQGHRKFGRGVDAPWEGSYLYFKHPRTGRYFLIGTDSQ